MMLKKCEKHGYTLKEVCQTCTKKTKEGHYKFVKIRPAKETRKSPQ